MPITYIIVVKGLQINCRIEKKYSLYMPSQFLLTISMSLCPDHWFKSRRICSLSMDFWILWSTPVSIIWGSSLTWITRWQAFLLAFFKLGAEFTFWFLGDKQHCTNQLSSSRNSYLDNVRIGCFLFTFDCGIHVLWPLKVKSSFGYVFICIITLISIEYYAEGIIFFHYFFLRITTKGICDRLERRLCKVSFLFTL